MKAEKRTIRIGELIEMLEGTEKPEILEAAPHQRQLIHSKKKKSSIIRDIIAGIPIGGIFFMKNEKGEYEILDGRQRIGAVSDFCGGRFSLKIHGRPALFENLPAEERAVFYDYPLETYFCEGTESDRSEWFGRLNDQGSNLSAQELRNCVYAGAFTSGCVSAFVTDGGGLDELIEAYTPGPKARGKGMETALTWAAQKDGTTVDAYMSKHQRDGDPEEVVAWFEEVCSWIENTFTFYRAEMRKVPWGALYLECGEKDLDPEALEREVHELMMDEDITRKEGIYSYVLTGDEKALSIRLFNSDVKREVYETQDHRCAVCGKEFVLEDMEADHIIPWSLGGRTVRENCQLLCRDCHQNKAAPPVKTRAA